MHLIGKKKATNKIETIIGPSVRIEGDLKSDGNIVVAGQISGRLSTTQNLRIEEGAHVLADIEGHEVVIAGEVRGNITINSHLAILATARINGDIKTGSISVQPGQPGAYINGHCIMPPKGC